MSIACKVFLVYVLSDGKRKDNIAAIRRAGKDLFNNIQSSFLIRACNCLSLRDISTSTRFCVHGTRANSL